MDRFLMPRFSLASYLDALTLVRGTSMIWVEFPTEGSLRPCMLSPIGEILFSDPGETSLVLSNYGIDPLGTFSLYLWLIFLCLSLLIFPSFPNPDKWDRFVEASTFDYLESMLPSLWELILAPKFTYLDLFSILGWTLSSLSIVDRLTSPWCKLGSKSAIYYFESFFLFFVLEFLPFFLIVVFLTTLLGGVIISNILASYV